VADLATDSAATSNVPVLRLVRTMGAASESRPQRRVRGHVRIDAQCHIRRDPERARAASALTGLYAGARSGRPVQRHGGGPCHGP
jgi:hypothetical protein